MSPHLCGRHKLLLHKQTHSTQQIVCHRLCHPRKCGFKFLILASTGFVRAAHFTRGYYMPPALVRAQFDFPPHAELTLRAMIIPPPQAGACSSTGVPPARCERSFAWACAPRLKARALKYGLGPAHPAAPAAWLNASSFVTRYLVLKKRQILRLRQYQRNRLLCTR